MVAIVTRAGKGSALTWDEADANFTNLNNKVMQIVSVKDFGAVGDGVADDTAAIQAAITAAESSNKALYLPSGKYKCTSALNIGLSGAVRIYGDTNATLPASYESGTTLDFSSAPAGINALTLAASGGARREGIELHNILVYRSSANPTVDDGTIGLKVVGLIGFVFKSVVTIGFDIGAYFTETSSAGVCSGGIVEMCRFEENGRAGIKVDACIEAVFIRNKYGEAKYPIWILASTSGYKPNGNQWYGGTAIASAGYLADNSIRIDEGFYNLFDGIATEQASSYGVYVNIPVASAAQDHITASFRDIWQDTVGGIYCYNANIEVVGSRVRSSIAACPALTLDSNASVTQVLLNSRIANNHIHWTGGASGINLARYSNAVISNNFVSDSASSGAAFVTFSASASRNSVVGNIFYGSATPGYAGTLGSNYYNNWIGSNGVFENTTQPKVFGQYSYTMAVTSNWQRSGTGAANSSLHMMRQGGGGSQLLLGSVQSTDGTYGLVNAVSDVGIVRAYGGDGSVASAIGSISFQTDSSVSAGNLSGRILFATKPSGGSETTRFQLDSTGVLKPSSDNAYTLGESGFRWASVWSANGTIQTSDAREKDDIVESSLGLDFINSLRPVSYRWKSGGTEVIRQVYRDINGNECDQSNPDGMPAEIITKDKPGTRTHWGLIAQEVKAVCDNAGVDFAGWVLTDKDDPDSQQALRYDQFIAPLIKAIQELSERIQVLEKE